MKYHIIYEYFCPQLKQMARLRLAVIDVVATALGNVSTSMEDLVASFEIDYDNTATATDDNTWDDSQNEVHDDDADDFLLPENRRRDLSIEGTSPRYRWYVTATIVALEQDVIAASAVNEVDGAALGNQWRQLTEKNSGSDSGSPSSASQPFLSLGSSSSRTLSLPSANLLATLVFQALSSPLFPATVDNRSVGLTPVGDVTAAEAGTHVRALRTLSAAAADTLSYNAEYIPTSAAHANHHLHLTTTRKPSVETARSRALLYDQAAPQKLPVSSSLSSFQVRLGSMVGSGVYLSAELSGLEPFTAGGLHVHSGMSCATHGAVGGHYFSSSTDPWTAVKWESDAHGVASVVGPDLLNYTLRGSNGGVSGDSRYLPLEGHAVVLHDSYGDRIACGLLAGEAPTPFPTPSIIGNHQITLTLYIKFRALIPNMPQLHCPEPF